MPESEIPASNVHRRGAEPSLIERFGIEGLYGYRSISLESDYAATILIAKNGTGKTTLLGALDAFLRMQLSRLRNLEFAEIRCKLRGEDNELILSHNDVIEFLQIPTDGELIRLASRASIEPSMLFTFLLDEWNKDEDFYAFGPEKNIISSLHSALNYDRREVIAAVEKTRASLMERQPSVSKIFRTLQKALDGSEIVYLPTYRRVELALRGDPREPNRRRRPKFNVAAGSLFTGEIQFGLSDISDRLSQLNQQIILESNSGYRKISANIINELIDGSFESDVTTDTDVPSPEELKLFFERPERGRRQGPYMPVSVPNLEKIYSGEGVPTSSSKFLSYFLTKLATVIRSTKDVELPVDGFINNYNKYLSSSEPSTSIDNNNGERISDGKVLKLNRTNLRVRVESVPEGRRISLDALSSGEKQMISLFAKMYLYPGRKVVLIDEPELSLSIDWQRDILVDVLSAPLCGQLIAITHSPFVFDNELEPFARALKVRRVVGEPRPEEDSEGDLDE
jgi:predicted ATPase